MLELRMRVSQPDGTSPTAAMPWLPALVGHSSACGTPRLGAMRLGNVSAGCCTIRWLEGPRPQPGRASSPTRLQRSSKLAACRHDSGKHRASVAEPWRRMAASAGTES